MANGGYRIGHSAFGMGGKEDRAKSALPQDYVYSRFGTDYYPGNCYIL
ncbi:MAG: hypothetical protein LKF36_09700 [Lactobacillus sp.]|nr:hypothetical protein [Lactobacillus sp.]